MVNITLVCAGGMSTSMLMQKMKEAAKDKGVEIDIRAMSESAFPNFEGKTDVLLLGPQVSYLLEEFEERYGNREMEISVIDMMDYGMMNGTKVLEDALNLLK
ncbi:PTS sugar transporter subunit IIB [Streptococcus rifensis]